MTEIPKTTNENNSSKTLLRYHSYHLDKKPDFSPQKNNEVALLGKTTEFASPVTQLAKKPKSASSERTRKKYDLLHESQRVLQGVNDRIYACCKIIVPGQNNVAIYRGATGGAHFRNLCRCESWQDCAVCSEAMGLKSRVALSLAIDNWRAGGGGVLMLTETLAHKLGTPLAELILGLTKVHRALTSHKTYKRLRSRFGIIHTVKSFEDTYGDDNGWHPHFHVLLFLDKPLSRLKATELEASIKTLYVHLVKEKGFSASWEHGAKITQDRQDIAKYVSKQGLVDDSDSAKDLAFEVGMSKTKKGRKEGRINSWGILEAIKNAREAREAFGLPTSEAEEMHLKELIAEQMKWEGLWKERSKALKRRHHLQWSPKAKEALGVSKETIEKRVSEEEAGAGVQAFASIPLLLWRTIRTKKMQGDILVLAMESATLEAFWEGLWLFDKDRCLHEELKDLRPWDFVPTESSDDYEGSVW